ncbi:MAG: NADH-quinone oxidoreductase subunit L [Elusimicrobiales bacterium]
MSQNFELLRFIILSPLTGFLFIFLFSRFISNRITSYIACLAVFLSFVFSVISVENMISNNSPLTDMIFWWINQDFIKIPFRLYLDNLSSVMVLVVSGVSFLIHIYSISYMHGDKDFKRFFSYFNLFVFFMLLLVLADNLIITFFGWEGVGLSSYLLIGFWYENIENSKAAKKAFIVNRIGDVFFIMAIMIIYFLLSSASITEISYQIIKENLSYFLNSTIFSVSASFLITLFIFISACGKSAQFPLYIWLPDAMAGPTPVSALIHAATMVTAGVYLISRMFFIFSLTSTMEIILYISAFTSLLSAVIAIGQRDIKKILAYSTISQLGYMFMGVACGNYASGMFHLTTHAFFKALLFLSAGAVIHSLSGIQDIFQMGGLKEKIKSVFYVMLIGFLAISGFPYLSGYFSKDMIIESIYLSGYKTIWLISLITALLTSLYMTRMFVIVFIRKPFDKNLHPHHPDIIMMFPLYILAFLSLVSGFFMKVFLNFLGHEIETHHIPLYVKYLPAIISLLGIYLGYIIFISESKAKKLGFLSTLVYNKFYVDEIYDVLIVKPIYSIASNLFQVVERSIIDKFFIEGSAKSFMDLSFISSRMENSNLVYYISYIIIAVSIFIIILIKGVG